MKIGILKEEETELVWALKLHASKNEKPKENLYKVKAAGQKKKIMRVYKVYLGKRWLEFVQ